MSECRLIKGTEIIPKKNGTRTLVYPACGIDRYWTEFLEPDLFIGIDKMKCKEDPLRILGVKTKTVYYARDVRGVVPEIPRTDEVVLLLKCFSWVGLPIYNKIDQQIFEKYQEENLESLKRYLQKCEEAVMRKSFVIDFDGYEPIIASHGYSKILSLTPTADCDGGREFCDAKPCERAEPLFSWEEREKNKDGFACIHSRRNIITTDRDSEDYHAYDVLPAILAAYLKEK